MNIWVVSLSIMNNAAMIICKFLCGPKFSFLLGEFLGVCCLDYTAAPCLSYLRNHSIFPQQFPTLAILFYIPPAVWQCSISPRPHQHLFLPVFIDIGHPNGCKTILLWFWFSLMVNDTEHLCYVLFFFQLGELKYFISKDFWPHLKRQKPEFAVLRNEWERRK